MGKFNKTTTRVASGVGFIETENLASGQTFEGAPGFKRTEKSELFLLAVANFVGEKTFYESADGRDSRFVQLIHKVAPADPAWMGSFLKWLRTDANMRSASIVGAVEATRTLIKAGVTGGRQIVNSVLQRADEPGEMLAYFHSHYGRVLPKPIKRGIADAAVRLYNEFNLLKYDTASKGYRFGDVVSLTHPTPQAPWQNDLFRWAIERQHGRATEIPNTLEMLENNESLRRRAAVGDFSSFTNTSILRVCGMTWEDVLSLAGSKVSKRDLWESLIPTMGYMASLRNLRNFDEAGVSDAVAADVIRRLSDPAEVARSRQLPMRFLSAYRAAPSLRWGHALDKALTASLSNIPELGGRTLILVDTSGSMNSSFSKDGTLMRWDAAAVFGIALGQRCTSADVVSFSSNQMYTHDDRGPKTKQFPMQKAESLLRSVERWKGDGYFLGGGTDTQGAVRKHYAQHDRVVIITDEQASYHGYSDVTAAVPKDRPVYTWNLAGYQQGHAPDGPFRTTFGGLTDQSFKIIPLLESGYTQDWDSIFRG